MCIPSRTCTIFLPSPALHRTKHWFCVRFLDTSMLRHFKKAAKPVTASPHTSSAPLPGPVPDVTPPASSSSSGSTSFLIRRAFPLFVCYPYACTQVLTSCCLLRFFVFFVFDFFWFSVADIFVFVFVCFWCFVASFFRFSIFYLSRFPCFPAFVCYSLCLYTSANIVLSS
jgi:hypothetical protein